MAHRKMRHFYLGHAQSSSLDSLPLPASPKASAVSLGSPSSKVAQTRCPLKKIH
jgi:hypothetical protein